MATRTILIDDFDGSDEVGVATVRFSIDDQTYDIDLAPRNQQRLIEALKPFIDHARKAATTPPRRAARPRPPRATDSSKYGDPELEKIRAWARTNGFPTIKPRGRVPKDVLAAHAAATNGG